MKCVFGVDRRRVSAYSIVLRSALAKNISTMDIAAYIRDNGGVEEIRLAKSSTGKSPKEKAQATATVVDGNDLGTVGSAALSAMLDSGKVGSNTVLIGTWQANGTVVVRAVVESDTALTAALASHYASVKEQADKAAKAAKEKEAADAAKSAIDAAATSATVTAQ